MADVFVSYSRSDKARVAPLVAAIEAKGWTAERAKDWISRALLIDPENMNARYNFACSLTNYLREPQAALELLGAVFETMAIAWLNYAQADPGLDPLRDDPHFKAMVVAAETRLAAPNDGCVAPGS